MAAVRRQSLSSRQLRGLIFIAASLFLAFFLTLPIYVRLQHCAYTGPEPNALLRRFDFLFTNTSFFSTLLLSAWGGLWGIVKLDRVNRTKLSLVFFGPSLFYLILRLYPAEGIWTFDHFGAALFSLGVFLASAWVVLVRPIYRPGEETDERDSKN